MGGGTRLSMGYSMPRINAASAFDRLSGAAARPSTRWACARVASAGVILIALLLPGCATPPRNPNDLCSIFSQRPHWYRTTRAVEKRWGIDQSTQMAIIFQESSYRASARPPRKKILGFIPWTRRSSAYGYAQVIDSTWNHYRRAAVKPRAQRDRFRDASEFIGWYMHRIATRTRIDRRQAGTLYLAYHEGAGGYLRGTHRDKRWLQRAAQRVDARAARYRSQLGVCRQRLDTPRRWWQLSDRWHESNPNSSLNGPLPPHAFFDRRPARSALRRKISRARANPSSRFATSPFRYAARIRASATPTTGPSRPAPRRSLPDTGMR